MVGGIKTINMKKLIKLSDVHYIIVDDSQKGKQGYNYNFAINIIDNLSHDYEEHSSEWNFCRKITHSTEPLELSTFHINTGKYHYDKIKNLEISKAKEAIYGYSVEEMSFDYYEEIKRKYYSTDQLALMPKSNKEFQAMSDGYIEGFKAHQELVKDKFILTKDQLFKIIAMSKIAKTHDGLINMDSWINNGYEGATPAYTEEEIIESLLPRTEWNIEINEQNKITLL